MPRDHGVRRLERRAAVAGAGTGALSYLLGELPADPAALAQLGEAAGPGYLLSAGLLGGVVSRVLWQHSRTARRRKLFRAPGWAGRHDFADVLGAKAIRHAGAQVRPGLAKRTDRGGYKPKDTDYGQYLGRAVTGTRTVRGAKTYAGYEQSVIIIAPPGMGKTALMLHPLLDAPGAVLTASTKPDVYQLTAEIRDQHGPVALFNPQNVGNIPGDFRWDPLIGCEHYQAATDRAAALVRGTKAITAMQEASWGEKCVEILSKYLMAARLAGQDLNSVAYWLANPDNEDAVRILRHFPQYVPAGWASALEAELRSDADRMKGSIWSLARGAVGFMSNPLISAACSKGAGQTFDAAKFARTRGTLYLLGDDRDETIAPLLNALTDYVYQGVKATATAPDGGRLDPPFGFFLDEVTKITPVPLAQWAADARGHGIYITAITQSFDQLRERWGTIGTGAIKTLFSKVILGGIQNIADLEELSKLIGTRAVVSEGEWDSESGKSRSVNPRREIIMPPEEIRMLPRGHALVLMSEAHAVVVKYKKGQIRAEKELAKLRAAKTIAAAQVAGQRDDTTTTRDHAPEASPLGTR